MKKIILTVILSLAFIASFAQIKPKQEDWFFYDYSFDFMTNAPSGVSQEVIPYGHTFSLMKEKNVGSQNFFYAIGLDYSRQSNFSNLYVSTDLSDGEEIFQILDTDSIKRNRLTSNFIDAIFELRLRTSPNSKGKFYRCYVGIKGGVLISSASRLITNQATVTYENLGSLNPYRYGAYARIGYGWVNLFAYYGLSDVFRKGKLINGNNASVTGMTPVSIGLSFIL